LIKVEGKGEDIEGAVAAELNYGAAPDLQLTLEVPLIYSRAVSSMKWGAQCCYLGEIPFPS
jgi:hypothetical protein